MQKIFRFLAFLLVVTLGACGGGGGSGGEPSGTLPFKVDVPAGEGTATNPVRIKANTSRLFKISGGRTMGGADGKEKRSYLVNVEESGVVGLSWAKTGDEESTDLFAVAWLDGPKQTKITVRDADDKQIVFYVKTDAPSAEDLALYTTAPESLTIGIGSAASRVFEIGGGTPPYTATGANNNVAVVEMVGSNQWKVTGVGLGNTTVTIRDALGATKGVVLEVGAPPLKISPEKLTAPVGIRSIAKITGGQPPYRLAGGIPAAIQVEVQGDEVIIIGSLASKLDVTVADATGQTAKVEVEINTATTGIRFSPGAISISENDPQPIDFTIFGATGEVCIFTSDPTFLKPETLGCTLNRTVRLINGTRNSRCVDGTTEILVSVVDATRAVGTAVVKIVDNGACGSAGLAVTPTGVTVNRETLTTPATSNDAVITGGSGSYVVTSSDPSRATATVSGNVVTVKGGTATGTATITVRDQSNPALSAVITVTVN